MRWDYAVLVGLGLGACAPDPGRDDGGVGSLGPGLGEGSDTTSGNTDPDSAGPGTAVHEDSEDSGIDPDGSTGDPPPPLQSCSFPSTSYGQGAQELDVPTGSTQVLSFTVLEVVDPATIESATLVFTSHDADHPGEEGVVWVNDQGPYDLPAAVAWDNMDADGSIDVTGALVQGLNVIEFGAGSLEPRSFFGIADVALEVMAHVDECQEPVEPPPADAVPRELDFWAASYGMRHNWVLRCDGFEYAFSASGAEHIPSDCDGLYDPDGSRRGTATWLFEDVVPATYEIQIHSRHTVNRNPLGALFVVNGEGIRVDQRDAADFTTDVWGVRELSGDVTVVLDSSQEGESDSVVWVRLEPVPG